MRAFLGGEPVADTSSPVLVWEAPHYPPSISRGRTFTVRAGQWEAPSAALRCEDSPIDELRDLIRPDWDSMDAWFEEDEQRFTHARDPYTRVDILAS